MTRPHTDASLQTQHRGTAEMSSRVKLLQGRTAESDSLIKSDPARCANPGARILHRYGRWLPSLLIEVRAESLSAQTTQHYLGEIANGYARDEEDTHLPLWSLNSRVSLSRWNRVTLGEDLSRAMPRATSR
jgi:hypothetical protein